MQTPVFAEAVRHFWTTRNKQAAAQAQAGTRDQGARGAVTGGRQMDGFSEILRSLLTDAGVPPECIFAQRAVELPGFFRPTKQWDILIVRDKELVGAIELKSQVGRSAGASRFVAGAVHLQYMEKPGVGR